MSLFDSIGLPKWQNKNPEVRKQAIAELEDEAILVELVKSDPDPSVQAAALERVSTPATLDAFIESLQPPLQDLARARRLQQLLPTDDALGAITDDTVLIRIAHLSDQFDVVRAAIDRLTGEQARAEVASRHPVAKARLYAAQGIGSLDILEELMQQARGHDKAVYRHCKTLIDEDHARAKQAAERQEKILQLSARMEELAGAVDSPSYEGLYRSLVQQWQAVEASATTEQKLAFQANQAVCGQRLILRAEVRAEAEQGQAEIAAAQQEFPVMLRALGVLESNQSLHDLESVNRFGRELDALEDRWRTTQRVNPAPAALDREFALGLQSRRKMLLTAKGLIDKEARLAAHLKLAEKVDSKDWGVVQKQIANIARFLSELPWPDLPGVPVPDMLVRMRQSLDILQSHLLALDQEQKKTAARVQGIADSLAKQLDEQRYKEADRALTKARKLLKSLAPSQKQHFEQLLAPLAARLKEFHDWQNFAVEPKKEELCVRMSALIGSQEDVELLALQIQTLQSEWKQLGPLPQAREKSLWNKFKAAADEAWKPCKAAFDAEAETRRKNFAQRMELVKQLTEYEAKMWPSAADGGAMDAGGASVSAPSPEWGKVQGTLDAARAAFRASSPVDPRGERTSQKAFRVVCDRIYAHLHDEYQRNITLKQGLVTRAQELAARPELQGVVDEVKKLQAEWKAAGITPVGPDRKLWKEFRGACDGVFARLDQQREQRKSEANAQVREAESLRDQARALLKSANSASATSIHKPIAELKSALMAIDLPPPMKQRLTRDFQTIEKQARELAATLRKQEEQASWDRLADAANQCATADAEQRSMTPPWQSATELPKGINASLLESFWKQGPAAGAEEACRDACIALEVFGEIESPPEDKKARMNYQLQRLTQGLGNRTHGAGQNLFDLINAFNALRPAANWVERFYAGVKLVNR